MLKKIWNSKAMDVIGEVGYELLSSTGNIIKIVLEGTADVIKNDNKEETKVKNQTTYEYWISLTYEEQEEYFKRNECLKHYIKYDYYPNDRELTAKHVQYIANMLNREFVDKYDRY